MCAAVVAARDKHDLLGGDLFQRGGNLEVANFRRIVGRAQQFEGVVHHVFASNAVARLHEGVFGFASMDKQHIDVAAFAQFECLTRSCGNHINANVVLSLERWQETVEQT